MTRPRHSLVSLPTVHAKRQTSNTTDRQVNVDFTATVPGNKLVSSSCLAELWRRLRTAPRWVGCRTWWGRTAALWTVTPRRPSPSSASHAPSVEKNMLYMLTRSTVPPRGELSCCNWPTRANKDNLRLIEAVFLLLTSHNYKLSTVSLSHAPRFFNLLIIISYA